MTFQVRCTLVKRLLREADGSLFHPIAHSCNSTADGKIGYSEHGNVNNQHRDKQLKEQDLLASKGQHNRTTQELRTSMPTASQKPNASLELRRCTKGVVQKRRQVGVER